MRDFNSFLPGTSFLKCMWPPDSTYLMLYIMSSFSGIIFDIILFHQHGNKVFKH